MSKRLQVLLDEDDLREIRKSARRQRMTVSEWVRQALRAVRRTQPATDAGRKLASIREAARHDFPSGDIGEMLADIERGHLSGGPA